MLSFSCCKGSQQAVPQLDSRVVGGSAAYFGCGMCPVCLLRVALRSLCVELACACKAACKTGLSGRENDDIR